MCSCNKNKGISSTKSINGQPKSKALVSSQQKAVRKTREQLILELRSRISAATR